MPVSRLLEEVDLDEFSQWKALYATERERPSWSQQDELLASLIEVSDWWFSQLAVLAGAKRQSLPKPVRITRPTEAKERPERSFAEDAAIASLFLKPDGRRRYVIKKGGEE